MFSDCRVTLMSFILPHSIFIYHIENTILLITSIQFFAGVLNVVSENISNTTEVPAHLLGR